MYKIVIPWMSTCTQVVHEPKLEDYRYVHAAKPWYNHYLHACILYVCRFTKEPTSTYVVTLWVSRGVKVSS